MAMLFDVQPIQQAPPRSSDASSIVDSNEQRAGGHKLQQVVDSLAPGLTVHWMSDGDWSMHQLLERLLERTGAAEVWISSYAFSETPARVVSNLVGAGTITKLHCLIDSRVDVRSASALAMMRNCCSRLKLCNTHAKVTIVENSEWRVMVGGSANYTTNKRYEIGFISCGGPAVAFHKKWIEDGFANI